MPGSGHTRVEPYRIKYHSTDLATDVLTVKGYRGKCACGWVGPVRSHHSHARDDSRRHRRDELAEENAAPMGEAAPATESAEPS